MSTVCDHSFKGTVAFRRELESRRCHRLKKECFSHERPSRKRTRTSKPTYVPKLPFLYLSATDVHFRRVAQLEQKLDGLVSLLTSNQSTLQPNPINQLPSGMFPRSPVSLDSNASVAGPSTATPPSNSLDQATSSVKDLSSETVSNEVSRDATFGDLSMEPGGQEAESLLLEFQENMTEQFPFVVIHPDSTSQSLHHERPLLWKAIMVAASHRNSDRQLALGARLVEDLITRLLFRAEQSLELLQALLILIAWYYSLFFDHSNIIALLHREH